MLKKSTMFIRRSEACMNVLNAGLVSRLNILTFGLTIISRTVTPYVGDCLEIDKDSKLLFINNVTG